MNVKKYVLITGAGGFLGSYYVKELIKKYNIIAVDINLKSLRNIRCENNLVLKKLDITKLNEIIAFSKILKKKKIFVFGLINNAAVDSIPKNVKRKKFIDVNDWNKQFDVGLKGSYLMTQVFGQSMTEKKLGKIINIGSDLSVISPNQNIYKSSYRNFVKPATYSIIKHGLLGLTKYYANFFADKNVNVNMLSPGPIYNNHKVKFVRELKKIIPMKRMGLKQDLLSSIEYLLDDQNNYITGQNILVDGGRTII
tara:strand:+ start:2257 stop:3015 length:759 start_codon:yes stop_codon:yes gene_type:complete